VKLTLSNYNTDLKNPTRADDRRENLELPSLESFLEMRENKEAMKIVWDRLLPAAYGKINWQVAREAKRRPSEIATVGMEAFVFLSLENSYEFWVDPEITETKWTTRRNVLAARKYEGWGQEAIIRYNELRRQVRQSRRDHSAVEDEYLEEERMKKEEKKKKRKRKDDSDEVDDDDIEYAENDLEDENEYGPPQMTPV
jgi:hypothetical protein